MVLEKKSIKTTFNSNTITGVNVKAGSWITHGTWSDLSE